MTPQRVRAWIAPSVSRLCARWSALRILIVAVALVAVQATPPATLPANAAPDRTCVGANTDVSGLVGGAHPVILVHGWHGEPLRDAAESLARDGWQYLMFDYRADSQRWAADPQISRCLGRYTERVSRAHRARGGDGIVYLVGHSMGGIAIRFALDPRHGGVPDLSTRVGGVVTVSTPHQGSAWGATPSSAVIEALHGLSSLRLPKPSSRAWLCLGRRSPAGCERAPEIAFRVPVEQVVGMVTVRRTFLGWHAYDIPFAGDGVVSQESQFGYADAGRAAVPFDTDDCVVDTADVALPIGVDPGPFFANDQAALDMFADQNTSGVRPSNVSAILQYFALLQVYAPCSHVNIPQDMRAVQDVNRALDSMARRRAGVTYPEQLSEAPIPPSCRHGGARVSGGRVGFTASSGSDVGFAQIGLDGDGDDYLSAPLFGDTNTDGVSDGVVAMVCSAGGVTWPQHVLVYASGPRLIGDVDLSRQGTTAEHADIRSMTLGDGGVRVHWVTYEGAGSDRRQWTGVVRQVLGNGTRTWQMQDVRPDVDPGCGPELTAAVNEAFPRFDVAVFDCDGAWAFLGDAAGLGDTEQVWRLVDGVWEQYTGLPTTLCPTDVAAAGAPAWVQDLFAYRASSC